MTATLFQYPKSMRAEIERSGMEHWSEGGDYKRLAHALERAQEIADEKNFPIEVIFIGTRRTVYPKSLKDKGYY